MLRDVTVRGLDTVWMSTMNETVAVEHFKRTGCILPSHAGEVARWLAENNGDGNESD